MNIENTISDIDKIIPDRDVRRQLFEDMADFIEMADANNPGSWCITFPKDRTRIRLILCSPIVISLRSEKIDILLDTSQIRSDELKSYLHDEPGWQLQRYPEMQYLSLPYEVFFRFKTALHTPRISAFNRYKDNSRRTVFYKNHNCEVLDYISSEIGRELPKPDYLIVDYLVETLKKRYPRWSSFRDSEFEKDEIFYKWESIEKARTLLDKQELRDLLRSKEMDELQQRFETIGRDNNLLYQSIPMKGDLGILFRSGLDRQSFFFELIELLYGEGHTADRLQRYFDYLEENSLPSNWTFPTYFLFITHPETELFVKPSAAREFLSFAGFPNVYDSRPSAEVYSKIVSVAERLREELSEYSPRDMVDIQSFMWVIATAIMKNESVVPSRKLDEFVQLFNEFLENYASSGIGERHIEQYASNRIAGRENFDRILKLEAEGKDVTDATLLKLLPHSDHVANTEKGAWIHLAPPGTFDHRKCLERKGLIKPEDWSGVAKAILTFIKQCHDSSENLDSACAEFAMQNIKGFQSAMLTPILNALHPEWYLLVNSKVIKVMGYLRERDFSGGISEYPEVNAVLIQMVEYLSEHMNRIPRADQSSDGFDMFCHWMVTEKKHPLRKTQYWKIAPGAQAWNWDNCLKDGYMAMGWDSIGDLNGLSRTEFEERRDGLLLKHEDWSKSGIEQLWRFSRQVKEGDYIIANKGTNLVLGIGIVCGDYYYSDDRRHAHRIPVEWISTTPFLIDQAGWRRTMIKLDRTTFDNLLEQQGSVSNGKITSKPEHRYFSEHTFEVLKGLHLNPTSEYYQSNKDRFHEHLFVPFRSLFDDAISKLPSVIVDMMETEKGLYSRIIKNDWGKGGAWDFFWGAIYPLGEKRIDSPQLYLSIDWEGLEFGFSISDYGDQYRKIFQQNSRVNTQILSKSLNGMESVPGIRFGAEKDLSFEEWSKDIGNEPGVSIRMGKDEVLAADGNELAGRVADSYEMFFPLVLLAYLDAPQSAISSYLGEVEPEEEHEEYTLQDLIEETGFTEAQLDRWISALKRKKQCILYGPPGTGKTFLAEKIARHLLGGGNGITDLVQFHPSYAYEDFIQGLRPQVRADGNLEYRNVPGRFIEFCREASKAEGKSVLIIDEINRANLSSVFGELMYLLEYRDKKIPMAGGKKFSIPSSVYIIGTMNTADRSIALVDHALRRRFAFIHVAPDYRVLEAFHEREATGFDISGLVSVMNEVNKAINDANYELGITFFLDRDLQEHMEDIWKLEIEPYLEEYFFDKPEQVGVFRWSQVNEKIMS